MAENLTPKKYIDSNNMKQILTAIKDKTPVGNEYVTEEQLLAKDYATKTYVGEQIANAEHLKREIVTVLPSDEEASDNVIYMLKVESATGNDKYQEYMKIDGTVQIVGDTSVDLSNYAKIENIPTTVAELTDSSSYAKKTDIPTSLPANGGNANTVNNHTVKSDVPENAVFTDTVYDDTELNAKLGKLDDSINGFKNFQIVSSLGSVKLKEIIQSEFPKIKNDRGMIKISDGTTLYCGTYIKYSNTQGSVTFTNVEGTSYIWIIRGDTVTLQELATMDKVAKYPDWSNQQTISLTEITVDQDVYIELNQLNSSPIEGLKINGKEVSISDTENGLYSTKFSGYVKKGSVVSYPYLTNPNIVRVFPLV